ncbi:trypsin-like serine protease [Sphingobium sp. SYK-6]|uniref:trypsin-like serine protease n=1 Tax=Sphingobium sp. (strain NBRC 103272 / SYK-6) TaxID=627192 RepID=UPI000A0550DC|nr:trypsin-like serine protease [Sphingobium sp. SYK-6]
MTIKFVRRAAFVSAALLAPVALSAAHAAGNKASGSYGDMSWTAQNTIIAMTPTADGPTSGGGNPTFLPDYSVHAGVASLIMTYNDGSRFICSGSLAPDRRSIVTAAHCVSSGGVPDAGLASVDAYFYDGSSGDVRVPFNALSSMISVSDIFVNPLYTGEVIDHNDIAVLRLDQAAPDFAQSYDFYFENDLTGVDFNVAGYGGRSTVGGALGNDAQTGWLREGDNTYDFRLGDELFGTNWATVLDEPFSQIEYSYIADFDSGLAANDASCRIAQASNIAGAAGAVFCDLGHGEREAGIAGGDSGGPGFVDGKLASINSYGLSFGTAWGDCRTGLNSSCGEFGGFVPVYLHKDFILGNLVPAIAPIPEPAVWLQMIAGFGILGSALRIRARRTALAGA